MKNKNTYMLRRMHFGQHQLCCGDMYIHVPLVGVGLQAHDQSLFPLLQHFEVLQQPLILLHSTHTSTHTHVHIHVHGVHCTCEAAHFFFGKVTASGVLCCFPCCLFDLACFFLPSFCIYTSCARVYIFTLNRYMRPKASHTYRLRASTLSHTHTKYQPCMAQVDNGDADINSEVFTGLFVGSQMESNLDTTTHTHTHTCTRTHVHTHAHIRTKRHRV